MQVINQVPLPLSSLLCFLHSLALHSVWASERERRELCSFHPHDTGLGCTWVLKGTRSPPGSLSSFCWEEPPRYRTLLSAEWGPRMWAELGPPTGTVSQFQAAPVSMEHTCAPHRRVLSVPKTWGLVFLGDTAAKQLGI